MSIEQPLKGSIAIFFRIQVPPELLRRVCEGTKILPIRKTREIIEIAPGVSLGSPEEDIGVFEEIQIKYNSEKFMLQLIGDLEKIHYVFRMFLDAFKSNGYSIDDVVRYYEFNIFPQYITIPNFLNKLREMVPFHLIKELDGIIGVKLSPYSIVMSYPENAHNDRWCSLSLQPEHNTPNTRAVLRFTRRFERINDVDEFLPKSFLLAQKIKELFGDIK